MTPNSPPGCPFLAGPKIEDPQFFVGRTEALDFITSRATGPQPTSINIVGKRRIGKSSLLYHFCLTYEERVRRYGPPYTSPTASKIKTIYQMHHEL